MRFLSNLKGEGVFKRKRRDWAELIKVFFIFPKSQNDIFTGTHILKIIYPIKLYELNNLFIQAYLLLQDIIKYKSYIKQIFKHRSCFGWLIPELSEWPHTFWGVKFCKAEYLRFIDI